MNACPAGNCRLDLVLLSERIKPEFLFAYPYNALRNQAIAHAHTEVRAENRQNQPHPAAGVLCQEMTQSLKFCGPC